MLKSLFMPGILSLIFLPMIAVAESKIEKSIGTAKNKKGEIVYIENHQSHFENGKLEKLTTRYSINSSTEFGGIDSDFTKSDTVPQYKFRDDRNNRSAGVEWLKDPNKVKVFSSKKGKVKYKEFELKPDMVAGQGLYNYLRLQSSELASDTKQVKTIQFLVPFKRDVYDFRVKTKKFDPKTGIAVFRIEADSWLFRLMAPYIEATYDVNKKRLLQYEGPSNLLSQEGKNMSVIISYSYDEKK